MADKRIKDLDEKTLLADADSLAINDDSTNFDKRIIGRTVIDYTANYYRGFNGVSLTNFDFDNLLEPQVAGGSTIEIEQSIHQNTGSISITGLSGIANDNNVYIYATASGNAFTASASTTAPTWDTGKQGYYNGSNRAIAKLFKDASGNYTNKVHYLRIEGADIAITQSKVLMSTIARSGSAGITNGNPFIVAVPMVSALRAVHTSGSNQCIARLELYQDGAWRDLSAAWLLAYTANAIPSNLDAYKYGLWLMPGQYRLTIETNSTALGTAYIYSTDVYGEKSISSATCFR